MATYMIENTVSGVILGEYDGATEAEALDALARDAGYESYDDACRVSGMPKPGEIKVSKLDR